MGEIFKKCTKCGEEKPTSDFYKSKSGKFGVSSICKVCNSIQRKEYAEKNREKLNAKKRQYYLENKDKIKEYWESVKEHRKEYMDAYNKDYYLKNSEKIRTATKEYYENNKEIVLEKQTQYYLENRERIAISGREYRKRNAYANRDKSLAAYAKYRATKLNATPDWLTEDHLEEIKDFYTACLLFKMYTGEHYHVDHIVPLQNDIVCGLHVPWNLQILTAFENTSKGNKFNN